MKKVQVFLALFLVFLSGFWARRDVCAMLFLTMGSGLVVLYLLAPSQPPL